MNSPLHPDADGIVPLDTGADGHSRVAAALTPPASRRLLADEVYEILRSALVSMRIAPGSRMNLDQLARDLHVSNTPVRQALARLEADGLVTKEPFRGFMASPLLDRRSIEDLYEFRLMVEPELAALAASRRGDAEATTVMALADPAGPDGAHDNPELLGVWDRDFHLGIADIAGNDVASASLRTALATMHSFSIYGRFKMRLPAWDEHRAVAEAIAMADPDGARRAMRSHLELGRQRVRDAVR